MSVVVSVDTFGIFIVTSSSSSHLICISYDLLGLNSYFVVRIKLSVVTPRILPSAKVFVIYLTPTLITSPTLQAILSMNAVKYETVSDIVSIFI